jgi:hypothetical protein
MPNIQTAPALLPLPRGIFNAASRLLRSAEVGDDWSCTQVRSK